VKYQNCTNASLLKELRFANSFARPAPTYIIIVKLLIVCDQLTYSTHDNIIKNTPEYYKQNIIIRLNLIIFEKV